MNATAPPVYPSASLFDALAARWAADGPTLLLAWTVVNNPPAGVLSKLQSLLAAGKALLAATNTAPADSALATGILALLLATAVGAARGSLSVEASTMALYIVLVGVGCIVAWKAVLAGRDAPAAAAGTPRALGPRRPVPMRVLLGSVGRPAAVLVFVVGLATVVVLTIVGSVSLVYAAVAHVAARGSDDVG